MEALLEEQEQPSWPKTEAVSERPSLLQLVALRAMVEDWAVLFLFSFDSCARACTFMCPPVSFVFLLRLLHAVVVVVGSASLAFVTAVDAPPPPGLLLLFLVLRPELFPNNVYPSRSS